MNQAKLSKRYESLVATMNVPQIRKTGTTINALWFLRQGGIANINHKDFYDACQVAVKLANTH